MIKIARETGWGYTRVLGELRKLGIHDISRQTVVNILKENGYDPDSKRGPGSWDELLKMHAETLWQCDFFSKRVLSRFGMPQLFAMVFLNLATRRVWVSPATRHPTEDWVEQQAKAFIAYAKTEELKVDLVTRDNDQIYKRAFDRVMKEAGARPRRLALRPQHECLRGAVHPINPGRVPGLLSWSSARSTSTTWFRVPRPLLLRVILPHHAICWKNRCFVVCNLVLWGCRIVAVRVRRGGEPPVVQGRRGGISKGHRPMGEAR